MPKLFFEELEDFAAEIAPHLQSQQIFGATEDQIIQTMSRLHERQTFEATESDMVVPTIDYPQTPQSNENREEDAVVPTMFN